MSRIGANIAGIERYLLQHLADVEAAAIDNSVRLATGKKINFPSDDPAAFFLVSGFQQRLNIVNETKTQVEIAANVGAEMQSTLDLLRSNLESIYDLLVGVQDGTVEDEAEAQSQIDDLVDEIDTLAQTEIGGRRFLSGSVDFLVSGRNSAHVSEIDIRSVRDTTISGSVLTAATQASVTYNGSHGEVRTGDTTFELTGDLGSVTIDVTNREDLDDVRDRINAETYNTGVSVEVSGNDLIFTSLHYGEDAFIDIDVTDGTFSTAGDTEGTDAVATINGVEISSNNVDGNRLTYNRNGLHFTLELAEGYTGEIDEMTVSDESTAKFALSTDLHQVTEFSLSGVTSAHLGGDSGRLYQLASGGALVGMGDNLPQAIQVVTEALSELTLVEGRVDAFADVTVQSSSDLLDAFSTTLNDSLDSLNEVDEDEESLLLAKNQSLSDNTVAAISILQQQQSSMLNVLQVLAGLQ